MSRVIVTGGAGFIGSHCVDLLVHQGYEVLVIDDLSFGNEENINLDAKFDKINICDLTKLTKTIINYDPNTIFHFAANATTKSTSMGWKDPIADYKINMVGTLNILESIRHNNNIHLIYASTAAVYGEPSIVPINENHITMPLSPYGVSKLSGEKYCHAYSRAWKVKSTIVRIFNTYGPRQPRYVMFDQMKKILNCKNKTFEVLGSGEQLRDYAYVSDTVKAFYKIMLNPEKSIGQIFNVAGGSKVSIKELIKEIKKVLNKENLVENFTGKSWKGDIDRLWADTTKIINILNWQPKVSLNQGLEFLAQWLIED